MLDLLAPIALIAGIFLISYLDKAIVAKGKEKLVDQELRLREADIAEKIVDFRIKELDHKAEPIPLDSKVVNADYELLEDKRKKR